MKDTPHPTINTHPMAGVVAVAYRNYLVWKELLGSTLTSNILNPLIFLYAFGFGLGGLLNTMDGISYMAYVVGGMMAYFSMFSASFETTIGGFSRFHTQKTYEAILATTIDLKDIIGGEILWASARGLISAFAVLVVGGIFGGIGADWPHILLALVIIFIGSAGFAAIGLWFTSMAKGYEFFNYFFTLWVTPNFVFTGLFFSIDRYPEWVVWLGKALPVYHIASASRMLTSTMEIDWLAIAGYTSYLTLWLVVAFYLSHRNLSRRLFD